MFRIKYNLTQTLHERKNKYLIRLKTLNFLIIAEAIKQFLKTP